MQSTPYNIQILHLMQIPIFPKSQIHPKPITHFNPTIKSKFETLQQNPKKEKDPKPQNSWNLNPIPPKFPKTPNLENSEYSKNPKP